MKKWLLIFVLLLIGLPSFGQNPWNGKVVLQAYWWDYWNNNYPNGWYNYLAELAPRLRGLGIDAVWIPPSSKGGNGTGDVGYGTFDHYDLGDKYQKGTTKTRLGTKDEYLRMVAIMHANGVDVIQDVVLNHTFGAGSLDGSGGSDPNAWDNKYKNFRYVSYSTPATNETAANYLARSGRWSKNWQNFNPNPGNNNNSGDWDSEMFGPDNSYYSGASGKSSNATFNPTQSNLYMREQARDWMVWLKKQSGVDGFRLDAVKHFPYYVTQDVLWNVKYNAGWANGGANMFAVGEYVGGTSELDTWINNVQYSNSGSEELIGTFDFSFRSAIYSMVQGGGYYNMSSLTGAQQNRRLRTVPFVNNHDTFRPQLNSSGNYTGWDSGNELAPHIDPFNDRLPAAYAVLFAVDGSPQIFMEDLFNISNGKRYTHVPTNTTDLPVRAKIQNIIWAHQTLSFKAGAYKVRSAEGSTYFNSGSSNQDLLVIERSAKAVIGVNDNGSNWQSCYVNTDFAPGTVLKDYSGNSGSWTYTVPGDKRVLVNVPPSNAAYGGYVIIGPTGYDNNSFNPAQRSTTQEWEMDNDLGDSNTKSLQQGGALPAGSAALRTAGRIFVESGKVITANLYPTNTTRSHTINVYNSAGTIVKTVAGVGTLTATYTASATGWYTLKAKHTSASSAPLEKIWIKASYTAPKAVVTASYPMIETTSNDDTELAATEENTILSDFKLESTYPNPFNPTTLIRYNVPEAMSVKLVVYNMLGQQVSVLVDRTVEKGHYEVSFDASGLSSGVYIYQLQTPVGIKTGKMTLAK